MENSKKVALGGIVTALSFILMFLTGLISIGTYALPALAGIALVIIVIELGNKWAWMVFAAVSILSVFFAADKEAAVLFVFFFGYYPILKENIERLSKKFLQYVIKFLVFNAAMIISFLVSVYILHIPSDSFIVFGISIPLVFLLVGNVVFLLYDYAVSEVISTYINKFHHMMKRIMRL